jgi:hypothetical protein
MWIMTTDAEESFAVFGGIHLGEGVRTADYLRVTGGAQISVSVNNQRIAFFDVVCPGPMAILAAYILVNRAHPRIVLVGVTFTALDRFLVLDRQLLPFRGIIVTGVKPVGLQAFNLAGGQQPGKNERDEYYRGKNSSGPEQVLHYLLQYACVSFGSKQVALPGSTYDYLLIILT